MARSRPVENILPQNVKSISTTSSNLLKQPNVELLVAVDHNQLRTMASETVDLIVWSHPHPLGKYPMRIIVQSINQCSLSHSRASILQPAAWEATTLSII